MIVVFTNCMLLGFLSDEVCMHFGMKRYSALVIAASVFCVSALLFVIFIRNWLRHRLLDQGLTDVAAMRRLITQSTRRPPSTETPAT